MAVQRCSGRRLMLGIGDGLLRFHIYSKYLGLRLLVGGWAETHLKKHEVKLDHETPSENKIYLKPPPSLGQLG